MMQRCFIDCNIVLYLIMLLCNVVLLLLCSVILFCIITMLCLFLIVLFLKLIATVGGSLCSLRACVHVLISLLQRYIKRDPLPLNFRLNDQKTFFLPPAHSISCIDSCILSFSKRNKSIYRYMSCKIVSTDKVTHRKQVVAVVFFTIFN